MTGSEMICMPGIFVTLGPAILITLIFQLLQNLSFVDPTLAERDVALKESSPQFVESSSLSQSSLSSIRFAFQLVDLSAYNSSVRNFDSLATVLCVQHTDLISFYSLANGI